MAEKIKILHVLDSLNVGGMERVVINVANGLDPARFEQAVCCISRLGTAAHLLDAHVQRFDMGKGDERALLMPWQIAKLMRRERPDIIHTQSWAGMDGVIARTLARQGKLVHSEHGRNLPYIHHEPPKRKLARRCAYELADAVFVVSEEMRQYFCRETGFAPARMRVIHNGVDVAGIERADPVGVREELGLSPTDFVIGTVARFQETKDLPTLVRAFAQLRQRQAHVKLLLIGDGAERGRLEQLALELSVAADVIITGIRHDVPRLLRALDAFALSSLSEGLPISVLEALAAALPVVTTRVGMLPEMLREGENGFLVAPGDVAVLAERLERLVINHDLARRLGAVGKQTVERDYSLAAMLRRYEELYLSLVGAVPRA
ncbi:MAG: glycosyltransferase [Acidobacteria bacterium]|nr:glycosyltransferase [Acidobacteriota bacterium]MBI3422435.1 glycosyltransferase [Acidobacteriota bacterium]